LAGFAEGICRGNCYLGHPGCTPSSIDLLALRVSGGLAFLILRLETQATQDSGNPPLLLTLASAQAMLGVILGDLLPEEDLWISVQFFKQAAALVEEHGDARLQAEVYRGCGNELRKHRQYAEAISYLERAFSLAPDGMS